MFFHVSKGDNPSLKSIFSPRINAIILKMGKKI